MTNGEEHRLDVYFEAFVLTNRSNSWSDRDLLRLS
jgi:hypothetical protein